MASLNRVFLMGNLTRDPELRYTPTGAAVASFGLAVNRKYKQGEEWKEEVCFVDITVWGKQGENCAEYLSKGKGAMVEGRLQYRTWQTEDGQKRSKLDVVANNVQFLSGPGKTGANEGDKYSQYESSGEDKSNLNMYGSNQPEEEDLP